MRTTVLAVGLIVGIAGSTAVAGTLMIGPTRYGTTYAETFNYGPGSTSAHAGRSPGFLVRGGSNIHRGYMVFDLSHPDLVGKTVVSVTFDLTRGGASGPEAQVWGKHAATSDAFLGYSAFNSFVASQIDTDSSTHQSIINDGTLLGTLATSSSSTALSDPAYFESKIGSEVLLFARLTNDLTTFESPYGPEGAGDGGAKLTIEYTDGPVIPLPHAGGMALAGLGVLAMRRRRV